MTLSKNNYTVEALNELRKTYLKEKAPPEVTQEAPKKVQEAPQQTPQQPKSTLTLQTVRDLEKNALGATLGLLQYGALMQKYGEVKKVVEQPKFPVMIEKFKVDDVVPTIEVSAPVVEEPIEVIPANIIAEKQKVQAVLSGIVEEKQKIMETKAVPTKQINAGFIQLPKTSKKERSLNFGIVGFGGAGAKITEVFFDLGYNAISIGSIDDLELHQDHAVELITKKLSKSQANIICLSLGGISNARASEILVNILSDIKKPIIVLGILPFDGASVYIKQNVLRTLAVLNKYVATKKISNLIIVDNAKLNFIHKGGTDELEFYNIANKNIVDVINSFNTFTSEVTSLKSFSMSDWAKLINNGQGITVYGKFALDNFKEEISLAEGVIDKLYDNLFAREFDVTTAKYVGVIFTANKDVWEAMPKTAIEYAMQIISDQSANNKIVSHGLYVTNDSEPTVKIYTMFGGLDFPQNRIDQIKKEIETIKK